MTDLTLRVNHAAKTVAAAGKVAAGEDVALTVVMDEEVADIDQLRVRLRFMGRDVAVFPFPGSADEWSSGVAENGEYPYTGVLNLNTAQLLGAFTELGDGAVLTCNVVVDQVGDNDGGDDYNVLYGKGVLRVWNWNGDLSVTPTVDEAPAPTSLREALNGKVDKVQGKRLSTNDFTDAEKEKLAGIADGATNVTVDSLLSGTSENAVQNKVVKAALDLKADASALTSLETTVAGKAAAADLASGVAEAKTYADGKVTDSATALKNYTDGKVATKVAAGVAEAKAYVNSELRLYVSKSSVGTALASLTDLPDTATQRDIRMEINALLVVLRSLAVAVVAAFASQACATPWEDVRPGTSVDTNTVGISYGELTNAMSRAVSATDGGVVTNIVQDAIREYDHGVATMESLIYDAIGRGDAESAALATNIARAVAGGATNEALRIAQAYADGVGHSVESEVQWASEALAREIALAASAATNHADDAVATATNGFLRAETDPAFTAWVATNTPPVTSVNGKTGAVVLGATDVGAVSTTGDGSISGTLAIQGAGNHLSIAGGLGRTEYHSEKIRSYVPRAGYYITWYYPADSGTFSRLEDLAPEFDPTVQYRVGDLVVYSDYGQLFRCTVAHLGDWDDDHFAEASIADAFAHTPAVVSNTVTKAYVEDLGISGGSADGETITNIVRDVASSATNYTDAVKEAIITNSIDAVTLTAFRLIVADLWRRVDTLEGADGSGYITAAQASALVDEAVADAVSLAGVTNNAPFVPIAGSYTMTTCTASPATVNLALAPNREHIVRYSGSGSASSLSIDSLACAAVGLPALLTISNFSVVSWPANATVYGTFSALNNNTYRVTRTSRGILCEKIQ